MKTNVVPLLPLLISLGAAGCGDTNAHPTATASSVTAAKVAGPFHANVLAEAQTNEAYRRVLYTGARTQLALMTIPPGSDIGIEAHPNVEQLIFVVSGDGKAVVNNVETPLAAGDMLAATPGARHNVYNTGTVPLHLYTIYAPPNHIDGRIHNTKADAERDKEDEMFSSGVR